MFLSPRSPALDPLCEKGPDVQAAELWSEDLEEEVGGLLPPAPHAGLPALHQQPLQ